MIKLNRTTEYGLMALKHMSRKSRTASADVEVTSAREIADSYGLPFEITAKTLQRLKDTGLIQSAQGARGGYTLSRNLDEISLAEFLELMEGPQAIVACAGIPKLEVAPPVLKVVEGETTHFVGTPSPTRLEDAPPPTGKCGCEYQLRCEIKGVMSDLNDRVRSFLSGIRLADLAADAIVKSSTPEEHAFNEATHLSR